MAQLRTAEAAAGWGSIALWCTCPCGARRAVLPRPRLSCPQLGRVFQGIHVIFRSNEHVARPCLLQRAPWRVFRHVWVSLRATSHHHGMPDRCRNVLRRPRAGRGNDRQRTNEHLLSRRQSGATSLCAGSRCGFLPRCAPPKVAVEIGRTHVTPKRVRAAGAGAQLGKMPTSVPVPPLKDFMVELKDRLVLNLASNQGQSRCALPILAITETTESFLMDSIAQSNQLFSSVWPKDASLEDDPSLLDRFVALVTTARKLDTKLQKIFDKVVPRKASETLFWWRYFGHVHALLCRLAPTTDELMRNLISQMPSARPLAERYWKPQDGPLQARRRPACMHMPQRSLLAVRMACVHMPQRSLLAVRTAHVPLCPLRWAWLPRLVQQAPIAHRAPRRIARIGARCERLLCALAAHWAQRV